MNEIYKQVKEGLENKVQGLETALLYVTDPREIERLNKELNGAKEALEKLTREDTRSPEELEKIAKLFENKSDEVSIENTWSNKTPIEKFNYQVDLYIDRIKETIVQVANQEATLNEVVKHLKATKGNATCIEPIIKQFENSLAEVRFSKERLNGQLELVDQATKLLADNDFFDKLSLLNRFLNNPMSLPHIAEENEAKLEEFRNGEKN